ncbi:MAG: Ig-like domain repeat protein, partial [Chloroflexales bacterium]|nr:Ig-like domain repeat protein [Chloroflexales bacterium]
VGAFGEPTVGVQQVWVTYTGAAGPLYGQWQSLDLARSATDDLLWEGTLTLPAGATSDQLQFIVQAANQVGLVSLDTNEGGYYTVGNDPGQVEVPTQPASVLALSAPATAGYGSDVTLSATLTALNGAPLPGQTIIFSVDTLIRQAVTDDSGVARASLPLGVDSGPYLVNATYNGSPSYQGAAAAQPLEVQKQASELALSPLPASVGTGATESVVATLSDAAGQPIVDETVALIVRGSGGTYSAVLKTDVAGRAPLGLIPLPVGSYTLSAYFGGSIPAPVSATYTSAYYQDAVPQSGLLTIVAAPDTAPPLTSIGSVPADPSASASATFTFGGSDNLTPAGSLTYECSLDGGAYTACAGPRTYTGLTNGAHTFRVRAIDAAGNRDQTPAFRSWTVTAATPAPSFPGNAVLDSFNRANGGVGASWEGLNGSAFYKIAGNKLDVQVGGALVWKPTAFGASQEAFVTLSTIDKRSPSQGVLLKVQSGGSPNGGAIAVVYDAVAKAVRVSTLRLNNPTWTIYANQAATFANGEQLGARALASGEVRIYKNGALIASVTLNAADKALFNGKGGKIGIWTIAAPSAVMDGFGGGAVTP